MEWCQGCQAGFAVELLLRHQMFPDMHANLESKSGECSDDQLRELLDFATVVEAWS